MNKRGSFSFLFSVSLSGKGRLLAKSIKMPLQKFTKKLSQQ